MQPTPHSNGLWRVAEAGAVAWFHSLGEAWSFILQHGLAHCPPPGPSFLIESAAQTAALDAQKRPQVPRR